jgi:acyl-CoA dehydrogenase family protein 9
MADEPYEKILRDTRVYPIFEGANDVLRAYIALSGLKGLGEELEDLKSLDLGEPIRSLGILAEYAGERIRLEVRPDRLSRAHPELEKLAEPISGQVKRLRKVGERLLRKHGKEVAERQGQLKRLTNAVSDIYAQIAVLSRVSDVITGSRPPAAGEERDIAESFVSRAARRVDRWLDQTEENDDDRMHAIAQHAYKRGSYGHSL